MVWTQTPRTTVVFCIISGDRVERWTVGWRLKFELQITNDVSFVGFRRDAQKDYIPSCRRRDMTAERDSAGRHYSCL